MRFFLELSRRQLAVVATLGDKFWHEWQSTGFCCKKFNSLNFSRYISRVIYCFFRRYFQLSYHLCEGGYTCDFRRVRATRQFSKKSHHHREQKIARVAAALQCDHTNRDHPDIFSCGHWRFSTHQAFQNMTWTRRLAISNNSLKVLTLKAMESNTLVKNCLTSDSNFLVPRVLRLLGQRVVASRDSEVMELLPHESYGLWWTAQEQPIKQNDFCH